MHRTAPLLAAVFAAAVTAQGPLATGSKDLVWSNTTGQGSPILYTRVLYPSPSGGVNAPVLPRAGGWPVIVFLHGYGRLGRDYADLGRFWASHGFAVVQVDSSMWSYFGLVLDGIAYHGAITQANATPGNFFAGAFDTQRMALAGHSMGGGATAMILAQNPGYRCGYAIAPAWPGATYTSLVREPVGVVVGAGDQVTPANLHATPYFQSLAPDTGLKFYYQFDATFDHMNLVGLTESSPQALLRTADIGLGFFENFLAIDAGGLERCLGPRSVNDTRVVAFDCAVAEPMLWAEARPRIGRSTRISLAAEFGPGGILAAPSLGTTMPTAFGLFRLDASSTYVWTTGLVAAANRLDMTLTVPADPTLVGATLALQALGGATQQPLLLGSAAMLRIGQ